MVWNSEFWLVLHDIFSENEFVLKNQFGKGQLDLHESEAHSNAISWSNKEGHIWTGNNFVCFQVGSAQLWTVQTLESNQGRGEESKLETWHKFLCQF